MSEEFEDDKSANSGEEGDVEFEEEEEEEDLENDCELSMKAVQLASEQEGHLESPINLDISKMIRISLTPIMWYNHEQLPKKIKLTNTGYTVIYSAKWQDERPYISDGPLFGKYVFSQLHFHWGETEMVGSEHHVDGSCMAMEMHAVHFKADYMNQEEASRFNDGVIILVYFFKLQPEDNEMFKNITSSLSLIEKAGDSKHLNPRYPFVELLRPFSEDYFVYWSNLTGKTSQRVLWLLCREPLGISHEQVLKFQGLLDRQGEPIMHNCRPLAKALPSNERRRVFHVNPSGVCAYTLMQLISRDPPAYTVNQIEEMVRNYDEFVNAKAQ
ncbi:carbonic anhydrase 1-like [Trichogramma pretiosum]|uniref:carbonic anhydrase 1-like n=1 Tax=Trichogramma pretiosum TaxID=7493 RepID=UPI0006C9C74A|nr:carbonic anhydrase 1-like [Trichogramma pretiosum]